MARTHINILHMSDFHFDKKTAHVISIEDSFGKLLDKIKEVNIKIPIDVVVISGDIAQSGSEEDYGLALSFFRELKVILKRPEDRDIKFIACAGNHDSIEPKQDETLDVRLHRNEEMKAYSLKPDKLITGNRSEHFKNYTKFCKEIGAEVLSNSTNMPDFDYLYGAALLSLDDIEEQIPFIVLNSAWECIPKTNAYYKKKNCIKGGEINDRGRLKIGEDLLDDALSQYRKKSKKGKAILVFHHPYAYDENWIVSSEFTATPEDPTTRCEQLVWDHVKFIMNGHTHRSNIKLLRTGLALEGGGLYLSLVGHVAPNEYKCDTPYLNHCRVISLPVNEAPDSIGQYTDIVRNTNGSWEIGKGRLFPRTLRECQLEDSLEKVSTKLASAQRALAQHNEYLFGPSLSRISTLFSQIADSENANEELLEGFRKEVNSLFDMVSKFEDKYAIQSVQKLTEFENKIEERHPSYADARVTEKGKVYRYGS